MIEKEHRENNGVQQCLVTFSTSVNNPVVLYLHGGPGDSCSPLIETFNSELMDSLTLVVWEQRGAGLSYYKFDESNTPIVQDYVDDVRVILEHLAKEYGVERVHVIGHSWGSVIAIKAIQQFPELISSYIGVGQVIQMPKTYENQVRYVNAKKGVTGTASDGTIDFESKTWMKDVLKSARNVVKYGGSLYSRSNQNCLVTPFLRTRLYSIRELWNRQKGSKQSIEKLWPELMSIDFTNITDLSVPVCLVEGKHDQHVSVDIARDWYDALTTEKKLVIFEESGHFPQWEEAGEFNELVGVLLGEN